MGYRCAKRKWAKYKIEHKAGYDEEGLFHIEPTKPKVTFSNAQVTSNTQDGIADYFGINTLKQGTDWELTADVSDPHGLLTGLTSMNIIIEKVVNQTTVVSDERFNAVLANNVVTITAPDGFESTGNYMFTAKRQNEGLAYLGLAFEIEFDTVEFDIQRN